MQSDGAIIRSVKQLEKELYRSTSLFNEVKRLTSSLQEIEQQAKTLEELTDKDPNLASVFKEQMKDRAIISKFKELESNLHQLKQTLKKHEEPSFKLDVLLENYRTDAGYVFPTEDKALAFLDSVYSATKTKEVFFGPRMLGVVDINNLSKELKLEKASPNCVRLTVKKIPKLWKYLKNNEKAVEFVLDSKHSRISFVNVKQINVKSSSEKIKQFDRFAKLNDGFNKH